MYSIFTIPVWDIAICHEMQDHSYADDTPHAITTKIKDCVTELQDRADTNLPSQNRVYMFCSIPSAKFEPTKLCSPIGDTASCLITMP